jgi:hypothetical protein
LRRVLDRDQPVGLEVEAPLGARRLAVLQQALPERRVGPGVRDDARATLGELLLEELHAPAHLLAGDEAFLLEQLLHGPAHDFVLGGRPFVLRMGMRVLLGHAASSQCS